MENKVITRIYRVYNCKGAYWTAKYPDGAVYDAVDVLLPEQDELGRISVNGSEPIFLEQFLRYCLKDSLRYDYYDYLPHDSHKTRLRGKVVLAHAK